MDPRIESENESPPASQLEPRHKTASYAKDTFKENERQSPPKSPVRDYLTTELVPFLHAQMHCVYGPNFKKNVNKIASSQDNCFFNHFHNSEALFQ